MRELAYSTLMHDRVCIVTASIFTRTTLGGIPVGGEPWLAEDHVAL